MAYDRTANRLKLYRNGELYGDHDVTGYREVLTRIKGENLYIGGVPLNSNKYAGLLDEVSFYNRPLTSAEISTIHAAASSGKCPIASNQPPISILSSPAAGTLLAGASLSFVATATDTDGAITKVEFFDGSTKLAEVTAPLAGQSFLYGFTLPTGLPIGAHTLTARATDDTGATTTSTPVNVIALAAPPRITLVAPAAGSSFPLGSALTLRAQTNVSFGTVTKVEFFAAGTKLGETTAPVAGQTDIYALTLAGGVSPTGSYNFTARVHTSDGQSATSAPVTVTITSPAQPIVSIVEPANNATIGALRSLDLIAEATVASGAITKVEFFDGATKLGETSSYLVGQPSRFVYRRSAGLSLGSHTLTARAFTNLGTVATSAPITVTAITDPGVPPTTGELSPEDGTRVTAPVVITGTVSSPILQSYTLQHRLKTADNSGSWTTFATGTTSVTNGTLGTFDPTLLLNGLYETRLVATDTAGRSVIEPGPSLVVEGDMKLGAFTLAFTDLTAPLQGIPLEAIRTYDSRDRSLGDFGPGWRLSVNSVRLQKNRPIGADWIIYATLTNPFCPLGTEEAGKHTVTVTLPDGSVHKFQAEIVNWQTYDDPRSRSCFVSGTGFARVRFKPLGDTTGTLFPEGDPIGTLAAFSGPMEVYDDDFNLFDPTLLRLNLPDGTSYLIDERVGLIDVSDPSGNKLTVRRDGQNRVTGIESSGVNADGSSLHRALTVVRDAQGRVDYITDPDGRSVDYTYDAQGRLVSFTDREDNTTLFAYEKSNVPTHPYFHYLTKITDPRGLPAIRSEYDEQGRMIRQTDASGKSTDFTRGVDPRGRFERVKDRLGHETTYYYDSRGNILEKIDPEGGRTTYAYYPDSDREKFITDHYGNTTSKAYDARGNLISETLGASLTEDPANPATGYITRNNWTRTGGAITGRYNLTSIVDPVGRTTSFEYLDVSGNITAHRFGDATTRYTYHLGGALATVTDALGNITAHTYTYGLSDPAYPGAVKRTTVTITDPAGAAGSDPANATDTILRTTHSLYDAQENLLAQIAPRTLPDATTENIVTRYRYDAENRLLATIHPDGRVSETTYNAIGKESSSLEWRTVSEFEAGTVALARVTSFTYDDRGNLTQTTFPDGSTEATGYDAENRRIWSQDRLGHRTFYVYDKVGRQRFTIYPDANDGLGSAAPTSPADSRLTDNPRSETTYDFAGRVISQIDESGAITEYTYEDGCGCSQRRKEVIQRRTAPAIDLITRYTYDAAGAVLTVTDPRGNITGTQYDTSGRPHLVLHPATDEHPATTTETQYDLLGRRIAVIDQEGKLTRYRYDGLGRLLEVRQYLDQSLAAGDAAFILPTTHSSLLVTRYTYDEAGNQLTQTDALGRTTRYHYDAMGRRTQRILPKDTAEPAALTEQLTYDTWGQLWKRTDFAGKTTTFTYDTLGRLKTKAADATHPSLVYSHAIARVEYDYDASGVRAAARTYNSTGTLLYTETTPRDARSRTDYKDTALARLDYTYNAAGQLADVLSSTDGGLSVGYRYDDVNRLAFVDDTSGLPPPSTPRTTAYTYNAAGSLAAVATPNGVQQTYTYDALNRLRTLGVTRGATTLRAYVYSLRASGHRRQIIEASGRTTTFAYDDLYRLTQETIATDPSGPNGSVSYTLDKVGNRQTRASALSALSSQTGRTYNARDWLTTDTYDPNGNTTTGRLSPLAPGLAPETSGTDVYDFENRFILRTRPDGTSINLAYDADGNRIQKTILNAASQVVSATSYLVDTNNHTGYAQVVEEHTTSYAPAPPVASLKVYVYGADLIAQALQPSALQPFSLSYFLHDGFGSVRALTNQVGALTDTYTYDAFGNLIASTSSSTPTSNAYLYRGEQWDQDLGLYYNRARFLNPDSGRFWSMDSYEGSNQDPTSLHKYAYGNMNPVMYEDPTGMFSLGELNLVGFVQSSLQNMGNINRFKTINRIRNVLCRPVDNAIWEAHHLVPLFAGGAGSRSKSRTDDLLDGWTMEMDPLAHRGLHGIISVLLKFSGLPPSNTGARRWDDALNDRKATREDVMQVLLDASQIADITCASTDGYKKLTPRLKTSLRRQGYKIRGNKVVGSKVSYF
jgi:RHS repeat-associated protein